MDIDEVIWNMPISRTMKLLYMIRRSHSDGELMGRHERTVKKQLLKDMNERIQNNVK